MVPEKVRFKSGNVIYESYVDAAEWTIKELSNKALSVVGRYIIQNTRLWLVKAFHFTRKHKAPQRYQYWVMKRESILLVGVQNMKKGAFTSWWGDQLELDKFTPTHTGGQKPGPRGRDGNGNGVPMKYVMSGRYKKGRIPGHGSSFQPRRHLLQKFVYGHIDKIVEIESQYLRIMNEKDAPSIAQSMKEEVDVGS